MDTKPPGLLIEPELHEPTSSPHKSGSQRIVVWTVILLNSRTMPTSRTTFAAVGPAFVLLASSLHCYLGGPAGKLATSLAAIIEGYLSSAARTLSSSTSSSKGLVRNSTAPALKACIRIFSSPCPVMKMIGIL
jgi:hypothetical protein